MEVEGIEGVGVGSCTMWCGVRCEKSRVEGSRGEGWGGQKGLESRQRKG